MAIESQLFEARMMRRIFARGKTFNETSNAIAKMSESILKLSGRANHLILENFDRLYHLETLMYYFEELCGLRSPPLRTYPFAKTAAGETDAHKLTSKLIFKVPNLLTSLVARF